MPITLTYRGKVEKWSQACTQANEILGSHALRTIITSRTTPFDESVPGTLQPLTIANLFRDSTLSLTVSDYTRPSNIGGAYDPNTGQLLANVNAVHRSTCELACVLVHESVHALSADTSTANFTHATNGREGNENTAPYWIQDQVEADECESQALRSNQDRLEIEILPLDEPEAVDAST